MKRVLIVDDNDRYAHHLISHFSHNGWICMRAHSAQKGWEMYESSKSSEPYEMIITDITMETQTSGLWFIRKVYKDGFSGVKAIATTGFDVPGVLPIARWILPTFAGISFLIPKKPLRNGKVVMIPCR